MRLGFFLIKRIILPKRKEGFVFLMSIVSIIGIFIGTASLITVLGVMTGFDEKITQRILNSDFHLTILVPQLKEAQALKKKISSIKEIKNSTLFLDAYAILNIENRFIPIFLRGIERSYFSNFKEFLRKGKVNLNKDEVLIGKVLAQKFFLRPGEKITIIDFEGKSHILKVGGVIETGFYEFDFRGVLVPLEIILNKGDEISGIGVRLKDIKMTDIVKKKILKRTFWQILTWKEKNKSLYSALKLEKIIMFILLSLIILVASFNIFSLLLVKVTYKTKEIGILKSLGLQNLAILKIFCIGGLILGIIGGILGIGTGLGICVLLEKYHLISLPPDVYTIDYLPAKVRFGDLVAVFLCVGFLSVFSSFFAALKASKINPSLALRYE